MVTEGGLYILTLFDDFGGTYGKSDFGLGVENLNLRSVWKTVVQCYPSTP